MSVEKIINIDKEWCFHKFADKSSYIEHNCRFVVNSLSYKGHVKDDTKSCFMCKTIVPDFVWVAYLLGV
jgi:hypothetical protein